MSLEQIEQGLTYRNDYVECYCPSCKKLTNMKKIAIGSLGYYGCPCWTPFDYTKRNKEPTIIDLINYNRDKLG